MTYRINENINLPFKVIPVINEIKLNDNQRVDINLFVIGIYI
jgi:hypothetical protein